MNYQHFTNFEVALKYTIESKLTRLNSILKINHILIKKKEKVAIGMAIKMHAILGTELAYMRHKILQFRFIYNLKK